MRGREASPRRAEAVAAVLRSSNATAWQPSSLLPTETSLRRGAIVARGPSEAVAHDRKHGHTRARRCAGLRATGACACDEAGDPWTVQGRRGAELENRVWTSYERAPMVAGRPRRQE